MKRLLFYLAVVAVLAVCASCSKSKSKSSNEVLYNQYVEAFTPNKISRNENIMVKLSKPVNEDLQLSGGWTRYFVISPSIKVKYSLEENGTLLVMSPEKPIKSNKTYTVTLDLKKLVGAKAPENEFSFKVAAKDWYAKASFKEPSIDPDRDDSYQLQLTITTNGFEDAETVEKCGEFDNDFAAIKWTHSADGKTHNAVIYGIPAKKYSYDFVYKYTSEAKKSKETIRKIIPAAEKFDVWQCSLVTDNGRYIEVAFNKKLDPSQDIKGLVYIVGYESTPYEIDVNKIRFYYDQSLKGQLSVFVSQELHSHDYKNLESDQVFKIDLGGDKPELAFVKTGSLVPISDKIMIPFKATYYRGAEVRIIKIKEKNIGQFLQVNTISGSNELKRVGRLVARKTIFFDDENLNLSNTHTYALNLSDFIEPEPGAIYRVELSVDKSFSTYPGVNEKFRSKEEIQSNDMSNEEYEAQKYDNVDNSSYYYYDDDYDYYYRSSDPADDSYYINRKYSINVLATNLGIVVKSGRASSMKVFVSNLVTTDAEPDVELKAYNYQNEEIASAKTNSDGVADLEYTKSRPFLIVASKDKQRAYIRVDGGSALSTSDFNVGGNVLQRGIKGFIYGERGVWRPGDTLHLSFMMNDRQGSTPDNFPVTLSLYTPLGQQYAIKTSTTSCMGLYTFNIPTDVEASTGEWRVHVQAGGADFSKTIRIETVKPNRLKIKLDVDKMVTDKSTTSIHGEWLNGNPVRGLKYDITPTFSRYKTRFDDYADYVFEDNMNQFTSETVNMVEGKLDSLGNASIKLKFDISKKAPGKLNMALSTKMYEPSGDFSINGISTIYSPFSRYIGLKLPEPDNRYGWYNTGQTKQQFSIVAVDANGKPLPSVECVVKVYKLRYWWWWDSADGDVAEYVNDKYLEPVDERKVVTDSKGLANFAFGANDDNWGSYYIKVTDVKGGHSTGNRVYFDWPMGNPRQLGNGSSATVLPMSVDKDKYAPGELAMLSFNAEVGSTAILSIENGTKVLSARRYKITEENATIPVEVTSEMAPNVYLHVTLIQQYEKTKNDLPIRLYGIIPLTVDDPASHLHPVISMKDEIRSEEWYQIDVKEENGRPMAYSLAVVDEGLLDLTNFKTPEPWKAFNGKEALGVKTWDVYNNVLGAYGGKIDQLFSIGGDDAEGLGKGKGLVNRFRPVVEFIGPISLNKNSTNTHKFYMPNYTGKVKVMVIATDGKAFGNTDKGVAVKKPLLVLGTLPRLIGCNEDVIVPATVFATKPGMGNVKVLIEVSDGMEIIGDKQKTVYLDAIGDKTTNFHIKAKGKAMKGVVRIVCEAKGESASYGTEIDIQNRDLEFSKVDGFVIKPGESIDVTPEAFGILGTNGLDVEATTALPMNLNERLKMLIGYPHGCIEQTTSKVFAQLLLSDVCKLSKTKAIDVQVNVQAGLNKYRSFMTAEGGLAYWSGGTKPNKWGSIYAMHCLTIAEEQGYRLPDGMKTSLLNYLKRVASDRYSSKYGYYSNETTLAYCLYVLALNHQADLGTMNWLKEKDNVNGNAKYLLAGAYALAGRTDIAKSLLSYIKTPQVSPSDDMTFGSEERDNALAAVVLTDMSELEDAMPYLEAISERLSSNEWMSTQSTAFCLFAMSHFYKKAGKPEPINFKYKYNGKGETIKDGETITWTTKLAENVDSFKKLEITNQGNSSLFVKIRQSGIPTRSEIAENHNNITVSVQYMMNNNFADYKNLPQGTNFIANVTVHNISNYDIKNIAIEQYIPSGWEILNDRFINGFEEANNTLSYQDIRDDRVFSYIDLLKEKATVIFQIKLCATYPGTFYLPPIKAYAMYDNKSQANTRSFDVIVSEK